MSLDADDRPLVYVTYGSVAPTMPVFGQLFRATVAALADVPVRVLFTVAGADRDALGAVPDNVRVESWVPQASLMPHASAVLCHGGSGTTRMALAAGVPVVIVPGFADQPRNASRVDELGAGIALPGWPEGLAGIGDAVRRVLEEPSYGRVAGRIADEVAALPPVERRHRSDARLDRSRGGRVRWDDQQDAGDAAREGRHAGDARARRVRTRRPGAVRWRW